MQRLHLFELEDQPWVPRAWRDGATDVLDVLVFRTGLYRPLVPALADFMERTGARRWFDLCSGGGGGALAMRAEMARHGRAPTAITLTDRYPSESAHARVPLLAAHGVDYRADSVDALAVPAHPAAIRTMFSALHHFQPDTVHRILGAAVSARVPLAFVDVAASRALRALPVAAAPIAAVPNMVLLFVLALLLVPVVRPFRWSRLLWTYLVPVIPALFAWDGTVSAMRAYTPEELLTLARSVAHADTYEWRAERRGQVLMLLGRPADQA